MSKRNDVTAELKRLHSPDLLDMESSQPEDAGDFCILVQAMIGPAGVEGEESFNFSVCTPKWLARAVSESKYVFGRHHLFVGQYDYGTIRDVISSLCGRVSGHSWQEVAERLGRFGGWEFEDYK